MSRRRIGIVAAVTAAVVVMVILLWGRGDDGDGGRGKAAATGAGGAAGAGGRASARIDVDTVARGSIEGTVRDPSGAPVGGAQVCGYADSDEIPEDEIRDPFCAVAGPDGRYRLAELLPARYGVHAQAPRFAPGQYRSGDREEPGLRLASGEARRDVDITLRAGGVEVTGIVKDIGGGPVGGAWVYVQSGQRWRARGASAAVQSGADGTFRAWVAPGPIQASAEADGYARGEKEALAPGQLVEILLTPESVLAGRVVEKDGGAPVPGARVQVGGDWSEGDTSWASTLTDADGRFRIARVSPGRYKPTATAPNRFGQALESVLLGLGQTVEDIVIEVHPASMIRARVVLADGKSPCPEGWVALADESTQQRLGAAIDDGEVEVEAAQPGTYKVELSCTGYLAEKEYPEVVVAAGSDPPEQVWKVSGGARLTGVVLTHDGRPVAGANVHAKAAVVEDLWSAWQWETSEDDGSFEIRGLRGGSYTVTASPTGAPETEEPVPVEVPENGEAKVEIRLAQGGTIVGAVRDEDGAPVARVHVRALGAKRRWDDDASTQTLDDGTFRLDGVTAGSYRVTAMRDGWWGGELRAPGKSDDDRAGEKVEVEPGQTAHVDLVVERQNGVIRGRVVDGNGAPVTDAFVDAQRESESAAASESGARQAMRWGWARSPVLTDTDGGFAVEKLSAGKYALRAYRKGGGEALAEHVAVGGTVTLTIRATGSIAGTVSIDGGGAPTRLTLTVRDKKSGFRRREDFFRSSGAFLMRDLPAGDYEVAVTAAEGTGKAEATLTEGQDLRGVTITLSSRARVTGRLVTGDEGKPLSGYMIQVMPAGGLEDMVYDFGANPPMSDADGRFEVKSAPAGKVQIMAFSMQMAGSLYGFARKVVTLEGGKTTDLGDLKVPKLRAKLDEEGGDLGYTLKDNGWNQGDDVKLEVAIVDPAGPAAKSGLKVGDVIVAVDGQDVRGDVFLYYTLTHVTAGTKIALELERGTTVEVTAGPPRS